MIQIAPNKYEHNLLEAFWIYKPKGKTDKQLYDLLGRICRARLVDRNNLDNRHELISTIRLNEKEQDIVNRYKLLDHPNLEVKTRFLDVMMRFCKGKGRLVRMRQASDGYLMLYKETGTVLYLVRSIELRTVKSLYDEPFMNEFKAIVTDPIVHPGWMTKVLGTVIANVSDGINNIHIKSILTDYATASIINDTYWKDSYYDMLLGINGVDKTDYHYQKAINWERYADKLEEKKKENVFNAGLHSILQNAHNEIFQIKDKYRDDYKRIRDKYNTAKKDFVEAMSLFGVKYKYEVPTAMINRIQKNVAAVDVHSVPEVIITYLTIPFFPVWKKNIDELVKRSVSQSDVIERFFPQSQTLDSEGNVTGLSDYEKDQILQVHRYVRATLLYHILCMYARIEEHTIDYGEGLFYRLLMDNKQPFIEEDRIRIWAKAYDSYFSGDIITAGHLLMPQFEHALHNLLEAIVEDVTMLNNDVQKEPTLNGILFQIKPYCNPALYDELYMFFVDGNDVNYRNRLLHGLMGSLDMLRYGHYVFYLANLLFFKGKDFLTIGEEKCG